MKLWAQARGSGGLPPAQARSGRRRPPATPLDPTAVDLHALDLLADPTVVVRPDASIAHVNPLAARLVGLPAERLRGLPAPEVLPLSDEAGGDWWSLMRPLDADPRLAPRVPERDLLLAVPGAPERPVTVTAARVAGPDGRLALLVLSLRRAERRQRLDAARSDLVSTVSHELRSPLTSVKGFTKTLLAKWDRFTDDQKRQMLATVNEDADRVTRLLGELLDVSRIDAGRLQLRRQMIDVGAVVARVVDRVRVNGASVPLRTELARDIPRLYADPDKIEQVFTNLVENAFKYGAGETRITASVDAGEVRFTVSDDGGGIDSVYLRHIFTKFFRRAGERHSGTGLGLYISKGIIEAHGGRIWAESDPGLGTHFHFTLPRGGLELAGVPTSRDLR